MEMQGTSALIQTCLRVVEAHRRGSPLDQALDELERALQSLGALRRCVSCGEIVPTDEHSHECVTCGATLCNYCALANARCPGCQPDGPYPDPAAQDAVIELAQVRVTGEDSQHGAEVTLGPWQQVTLEEALALLQRGEYDIRVNGQAVTLWSPEGRPFRTR
ncbi:MAG: hypothetical protein SXV54_20250 [Chloroflexota bacterium]|nr:hypothetical protein [Chloroflexota bacterium]